MHTTIVTRLIAPLAGGALLLTGCNDPQAGGFAPAAIEIVSGDLQFRTAGKPLRQPLVVRVFDSNHRPVPGAAVTFAALPAARVGTSQVITDADGRASLDSWTLREDGVAADTLEARITGLEPVRFRAMAVYFTQVSAGDGSSCGLTNLGIAFCWGLSRWGVLGQADSADALVPLAVGEVLRFTKIVAGGSQTCGVGVDRLVYCTGYLADRSEPHVGFVEVGGGREFRDLDVYAGLRCGIGVDDAGYCWGYPIDAHTPDSSVMNPRVPLRMPDNSFPPLRMISVRSSIIYPEPSQWACVIDSADQVRCYDLWSAWGLRDYPRDGSTYESLSNTGFSVCGIKAKIVHCWGSNYNYALGIPDFLFSADVPIPPAREISTASLRTCALTTNAVWCWGFGRLPYPVPGTERHEFTGLSVDDWHACALSPQGQAWCWGANDHGQLGDGTRNASPGPVRVELDF